MRQKHLGIGMLCASFWIPMGASADTWLFDFGQQAYPSSPGYNNITDPFVHTLPNVVNAEGVPTGVSLSITIPFNNSVAAGTTSPSVGTGFPKSATRDSMFGTTAEYQGQIAPTSQLKLTNLDPYQRYDFTFFASRTSVTDVRETKYTVTGSTSQTTYLDASNNSSVTASLTGMVPQSDGTLTIDLSPGPQNNNPVGAFYIGAMRVVSAPMTCGADNPTEDDLMKEYPHGGSYPTGHYLYRPAGYSRAPCKSYPLLVWLHGHGERCSVTPLSILNTRTTLNSPGFQINDNSAYSNSRPFLNGLILQPQTCANSWNDEEIDDLIEYVKSIARVDDNRIYVTGMSMGAHGTWDYTERNPTKVAAIVPIAGTEKALTSIDKAAHVATWAFHNYTDTYKADVATFGSESDPYRCTANSWTHRLCTTEHIERLTPYARVKVMEDYTAEGDKEMAPVDRTAALVRASASDVLPMEWSWINGVTPSDAGAKKLLTIYAQSGHDGWEETYDNQAMWEWMYSQSRAPASTFRIGSPTITVVRNASGVATELLISGKITSAGAPLVHYSVDLKNAGGAGSTPLVYNSVTKLYEARHLLPSTNVKPGTSAIGFTALDQNGNLSVRYVLVTLN